MKYPYFKSAVLEKSFCTSLSLGRWWWEHSRRWDVQSFRASYHLGLIAATAQVPARPGYQGCRPATSLVLAPTCLLARQGAGREQGRFQVLHCREGFLKKLPGVCQNRVVTNSVSQTHPISSWHCVMEKMLYQNMPNQHVWI